MSNLLPLILLLLLVFISVLVKNNIGLLVLFVYSLGLSIYNIRYGLNINVVFGLLGAWVASFLYYKNEDKPIPIEGFDNSIETEAAKNTLEIKNEKYQTILNSVNNDLSVVLQEYLIEDANMNDLIVLLDKKNIKTLFELT
jgi:hypothetical protein